MAVVPEDSSSVPSSHRGHLILPVTLDLGAQTPSFDLCTLMHSTDKTNLFKKVSPLIILESNFENQKRMDILCWPENKPRSPALPVCLSSYSKFLTH